MRQRKATAYPQVRALVQPRAADPHLPSARHAMRMALQASRVKVSSRLIGKVRVLRFVASWRKVRLDGVSVLVAGFRVTLVDGAVDGES